MEVGLNKNQIITELSRSAHGSLHEYLTVGKVAAEEHAEFFAHLIAWDRQKGQVDDAKIALPVISLFAKNYPEEFVDNSLACLRLLSPRDMLKTLYFVLGMRDGKVEVIRKTTQIVKGKKQLIKTKELVPVTPMRLRSMNQLTKLFSKTLLERERNWPKWERTMLQHSETLKELFALLHLKPNDERTIACLHHKHKVDGKTVGLPYPAGGLFEIVANLDNMDPTEAAGLIIEKRIPFLVVTAAVKNVGKHPDLVLALIKNMTPKELENHTKMLERMGIKTNPALRGAYAEGLERASKSKANLLKTTAAVEAVDDPELKQMLRNVQKKKITLAGVEGDWLVLGDRSPSMQYSVEVAKEVAGTLTALVKGQVHLTFFDSHPQSKNVTGKTLDQIKAETKNVTAGGSGTSIGCGLQRLLESKTIVDGIAVVSDGEENSAPFFAPTYTKYLQLAGKEVPVYFYWTRGGMSNLQDTMHREGHDLQVFDLRNVAGDYYSLPNLVQSMRTNRYSLIDEIMDTPLLKLATEYKSVGVAV